LDHETPLAEVSFHDVSGLGQEKSNDLGDNHGVTKEFRGLGARHDPSPEPEKHSLQLEE
jgi:hypothetical protein